MIETLLAVKSVLRGLDHGRNRPKEVVTFNSWRLRHVKDGQRRTFIHTYRHV